MKSLTPRPSPADASPTASPPRERGDTQPITRRRETLPPTPRMIQAARDLRKDQTRSEDILWQAIRGRKLGRKFRRQHPIGRFIIDFYCDELRLAVEIDGSVHATSKDEDADRDAILNAYGIRVLRISAAVVESDLDAAINLITQSFNRHPKPQTVLPSPAEVRGAGGKSGRGAGGEG